MVADKIQLNTIEEAIEDIRQGKVIIVVDDEDRENEGDFLAAAEKVTPEMINFMATHGRGLICAPLTESRCKELGLHVMVSNNTDPMETAFTVSVDLRGNGVTTGISASDRAKTILSLVDSNTKPHDLARPGHIFPLIAKQGGVLRRTGHTEAAIDFARLAGFKSAGVIVEIMNEDGTMARMPQLQKISEKFGIKIITIRDLIAYRLKDETIIERGEEVDLPTEYGHFKLIPFRQKSNGLEHIALIKGSWEADEAVLVRVHSSCMTGDIFGSMRCDCGEQLHKAMKMIDEAGKGAIVYLNQEGRGIGLMAKIAAYKLQEEGYDTVDANIHLGYDPDERDYGVGAQILREIGIHKMKLLTNNPVKHAGLEGFGLQIVGNVPVEITPNEYNERYLRTKKERMGHMLHFNK